MTKTRAKITVRNRPCTCGCHGQDSQHKGSYLRTITNVTECAVGTKAVTRWGTTVPVSATGTFKHPGLGVRECGLATFTSVFDSSYTWTEWVLLEDADERGYREQAAAADRERTARSLEALMGLRPGSLTTD